jgi:hypothetical protein
VLENLLFVVLTSYPVDIDRESYIVVLSFESLC